MSQHILSKSTFMYGCQCPLRLYMHKFMPELRNSVDEDQEQVFFTGISVGLLAQEVFKGGINAEPPDSYSYHLSVAKTKQLIEDGAKVIYEAAFMYEGILCAIDILVNKRGKWFAYEVKGVNNTKPQHELDAALQYYVITQAGLELADISIMHLNKEYIKQGDVNCQELFKSTSILDKVIGHQPVIVQKAEELKSLVKQKKKPTIDAGNHCFKPYECDFTNHCWKNIEEEVVDYGQLSVNAVEIKSFLNALEYPLYFFDFETVAHAVPVYDGSRPYQQVPFQYSLHVQESRNSQLQHLYFLGDGLNDPREALINQLLTDLRDKGSILVWWQTFEKGRLVELARDFPKYEEKLNKLHDRIIDLILPFKKKHFSHPGFEGSSSIKNVLPVLVPELSYGALNVQDGMAASNTYAVLKEQTTDIQNQQRDDLLAYCHLDTLAMVKILDKLKQINSR